MVEAGELVIKARVDDSDVNLGTAGLRGMSGVVAGLTAGFLALGTAGIAALTGLAVKSPVLAGTMARLQVETLKLSNTVGRQLKPIFDAIANDLLPSLNNAFQSNDGIISDLVTRTKDLVEALADLISLDFTGLLQNLNEVFKPAGLPELAEGETAGPFRETKQAFENLFFNRPENLGQAVVQAQTEPQLLVINALIDTFQFIGGLIGKKETSMATSDGVVR